VVAFVREQLKDPEGFQEKVNKMYSQPDAHSHHLLEFKDGRYFERYTQPQHQKGQIVGMAIGFRDITERKLAAAALQQAHDELEAKVEELTAQLRQANEQLRNEIAERKRAEEELLKRSRQAALRADIGVAITQSDNLQQMLQQCAEALVRHFDAALARIWTLDLEEKVFELQASAGIYTHINGNHRRIPVGKCKISLPATERQPHLTNELIGDALVHDQEWVVREKMVAFAGYPLILDERVVAVMAIFTRQPLTDDTIQAMTSVEHGIGVGIQRLQVESALRASEERFRNLVETTSDWIWEIDRFAIYTYVSPKVKDILGYNPEEVWGKTIFDLMPKQETLRVAKILSETADGQERFISIEKTFIHKDGHLLIVECSAVPFFDSDNQFQGYRGITRDITERKRAEAEILKALEKEKELSELKSRFVSMASHEFRTPLATILIGSEILKFYGHKLSEEKKVAQLTQIAEQVKRMTQLLEDVLLVGKAQAGAVLFQPTQVNLLEFSREVLSEISLAAGSKHTFNFDCQGEKTLVEMDTKLMRQIISNLLGNAVKYSPEGSSVDCEIKCEESQAILKIRDRGIGIPASDIPRLFEVFHRASNVDTISGTGLGLAIVKQAVELHCGSIAIESEVGVGTTFTVCIPTIQPKAETNEKGFGN
jgi:PAS domain S-box-containing protein